MLGTRFDETVAREISIVELNGAFTIRYHSLTLPRSLHDELLSTERLDEIEGEQIELRKQGAPAGKYQDMLRAIGWELDHVSSFSVLLDEHDEGMLVSFQFNAPNEGYFPRTTAWNLSSDQQQVMLDRAYTRRQTRKRRVRDFFVSEDPMGNRPEARLSAKGDIIPSLAVR